VPSPDRLGRSNYPLRGLAPGSPRRQSWQAAADSLGMPLSDFIRWTCDLHARIQRGEISPTEGVEIILSTQKS